MRGSKRYRRGAPSKRLSSVHNSGWYRQEIAVGPSHGISTRCRVRPSLCHVGARGRPLAGRVANATDSSGGSLHEWGWDNGAYWLSQWTAVTFATSGAHTMRIQVREGGVQFDQIVSSPTRYLNTPPGPATADATIVPKTDRHRRSAQLRASVRNRAKQRSAFSPP
jgi:hypothetical protein